jgi:hypothetical protein
MKKILLLAGLVSIVSADISEESIDTKLVIYNNNQSLVEENRPYKFNKGDTEAIFPKVANSIITDSILTDFGNENITVLSQNYRNNLFSERMLLQKNIGKKVDFHLKTTIGSKLKWINGTLLAINPNVIKEKTGSIYLGIPSSAIVLNYIPKDITIAPELVWKIKPLEKDVEGQVKNLYLLNNLKWVSNYNIKIDKDDKLMLKGWIKINNNSGKTFTDINIKLLAGAINKEHRPSPRVMYKSVNMIESMADKVTNTNIEGYQLYTIPFKVSLKNKEETLVSFIDQKDLSYKREYLFRGSNPMYSNNSDRKIRATQSIIFKNEIPLPQGQVRIYKESSDNFVLVGEPYLKNSGKNEEIKLRLGENFNLLLKEKVISRSNRKNNNQEAEVEYYLKNSENKDMHITLLVPTPNNNRNVEINSNEKYSSKNANEILFDLNLKGNSEKRFKVKYKYFR